MITALLCCVEKIVPFNLSHLTVQISLFCFPHTWQAARPVLMDDDNAHAAHANVLHNCHYLLLVHFP